MLESAVSSSPSCSICVSRLANVLLIFICMRMVHGVSVRGNLIGFLHIWVEFITYDLYFQGEPITRPEATEAFFAITKLWQSKVECEIN